ncbi:hypothetical protein [Streptomyces sp. NPDC059881]|uniref:hypothetical protein n=1 Tax=Streptomyces sp. NPDC059881 TaxID=3346986 RepID=UPI0036626DBD
MPTTNAVLPQVIQGGMGVGVSGWQLARAVSRTGQLGVVSGTALGTVLARRLQLGDAGGDVRRALAAFPVPALAAAILERYYVPGGLADTERFRTEPMLRVERGEAADLLTVIGNFVEVWLANEGHDGLVGVNYLEKIQLALAPALFGAILAGVDHVLVGAGVPGHIPDLATRLSRAEPVTVKIAVDGDEAAYEHRFDPRVLLSTDLPAPAAESGCGGEGPCECGEPGKRRDDTARRAGDVEIGARPTPAGALGGDVIAGLKRPDVLIVRQGSSEADVFRHRSATSVTAPAPRPCSGALPIRSGLGHERVDTTASHRDVLRGRLDPDCAYLYRSMLRSAWCR